MTEQECLRALCRIQCGAKKDKKCEDCECFDDKVNIWKCVENTQESLVLRQLIREHFELVEKIKWLKEEMTEPAFNLVFSTQEFLHNWYKGIQMYSSENAVLQRKVSEYENPQPYKFDDLKELIGKPIFDYKYKEFYILAEVKEEELYKDEGLEKFMICSDKKGLMRVFFEEGRFFPVTKALRYCPLKEAKEDGKNVFQ